MSGDYQGDGSASILLWGLQGHVGYITDAPYIPSTDNAGYASPYITTPAGDSGEVVYDVEEEVTIVYYNGNWSV